MDGAMGTMLQKRGLQPGEAPELWNVDARAKVVAEIVSQYVAAGARVVETNSFGANAFRLPTAAADVHETNRAAAAICRAEAAKAPRRVLVAGSVGPCGKLIAPLGDAAPGAVRDAFSAQAAGLASGGADFLLCETFTALEEAKLAVEGCFVGAPGLPVALTMSFSTVQRRSGQARTPMGASPAQLVALARELGGVTWIGHNCGTGPAQSETVAAQLVEEATRGEQQQQQKLRIVVQSNAGLPDATTGAYNASPADMAALAVRLRSIGVAAVGGCCGTTPDHIAAMATALSKC